MLRVFRSTFARLNTQASLTSRTHATSTMASPHPVILCGKTEAIGAVVIEKLKPELEGTIARRHMSRISFLLTSYLVVQFIQSVETGKQQIPALLRGEDPGSSGSTRGSQNYEKTPVAVLLGAAFDNQGIQELRDAARGTKDVPWLRPDTTKPMPPLGPEYGKAIVERIKETVKGLEERSELIGNGGVVWF